MDLLWFYVILRIIAQSLRAGDPRTAGEQIDRDLDQVTGWLGGLLRGACGCLVAYAIVLVVVGVAGCIVILLKHWLTGQ